MELIRRVETALAIAGQQSALMILNLAEHTQCSPTLWAYNGVQVASTYLVTGDTDSAEAMVKAQVEGTHARALCVTTVIEASVLDAAGTRADALKVGVLVPGTEVRMTLVLPYGKGPTFDRGFHLVERVGLPPELDLERIRKALFTNIDHATRAEPGSALESIPRTLSPESPGQLVSRDSGLSPWDLLAGEEAPPLPPSLRRLATLAPFAVFLHLCRSDGKIEPGQVQAFLASLARPSDPGLARLVAACPADPKQALGLLVRDPSLAPRALAAAGLVCAREGGREALLGLARALAEEVSERTIQELERALNAGLVAAQGPDPFASLGPDSMEGWMAEASSALFAGFLVISAADGQTDRQEVQTFFERLAAIDHPLLLVMMGAASLPPSGQVEQLTRHPEQLGRALQAAAQVFQRHPLGESGRATFLDLLRQVASADGELSQAEERVLRGIASVLEPPGATA
jgi:hypothetical protein